MLRTPAGQEFQPGTACNKRRWVPCPSFRFFYREIYAGDFLHRAYNFPDRKTMAVSAIHDIRSAGINQIIEGLDMGTRKVIDMDVIPDAGPVRGRIIRPIDGKS